MLGSQARSKAGGEEGQQDIDLNERNSDGDSFFHLACYSGNIELMDFILNHDQFKLKDK